MPFTTAKIEKSAMEIYESEKILSSMVKNSDLWGGKVKRKMRQLL